jgi:hypothetical protein
MDSKDSGQGAVEESNVNYSSLNDDDRAPVSGATSSAATAPLAATVQVVSPADLPEGYQFSVVGEKNRTLVVEVVRLFRSGRYMRPEWLRHSPNWTPPSVFTSS